MYTRYAIYGLVAFLIMLLLIRMLKNRNKKRESFKSRNQLSMHEYKVTSKIVPGIQKASSVYDYPTANLEDSVNLPNGMYLAKSNFGDCVAFVNNKKMECHVKGLKENLYGKTITVSNFDRRNTKIHQLFAK